MQQHLVSPYTPWRARARTRRRTTAGIRSSRTGTRSSTSRSTCRRRWRCRATRTSTNSATRSTGCRRARAPVAGLGAQLRLRRADRDRHRARVRRACCRRPSGGRSTSARQLDKLWKPGDSIQLAIGQKDLLVTPMQMARFYALIANGGKLVTPHLLLGVEQPDDGGAAPHPRFAPPPPQQIDIDPAAIDVVRAGSSRPRTRRSARRPPSSATSRSPIAGKTGTAEKAVDSRATASPRLFDQSWWCGYGPYDNPTIVVCAVIENGGHGGTAAAPAALKVFEQYFQRRRRRIGADPLATDGRVCRHRPRHAAPPGRARREAGGAAARSCAGSTGCSSPPSPGSSPSGSGRSTASRTTTSRASPRYFLAARRSSPRVGAVRFVVALAHRPAVLPALLAPALRRDGRPSWCSSSSPAPRRAARAAGSTSASSASSRPSSGSSCSSLFARRLPRRARRSGSTSPRTRAQRGRRSPRCRSLLVFIQPDFGTALVYVRRARRRALRRRRRAGCISPRSPCHAARRRVAGPLGAARRGHPRPQAVPGAADHRLPAPRRRSARRDVQHRAVDHGRVGSGGFDGRGVAGATQTNLDYLPEHATDFVFASLAEQRGFFGAAILLCLYLLVVWRGLKIITVARDPFSAIVAGGIVFAFLFQIYVNVGMTMGIAPITGIPLPFVSVGGSSMIANLAAMGVLLSIHARGTPFRRALSGLPDQIGASAACSGSSRQTTRRAVPRRRRAPLADELAPRAARRRGCPRGARRAASPRTPRRSSTCSATP